MWYGGEETSSGNRKKRRKPKAKQELYDMNITTTTARGEGSNAMRQSSSIKRHVDDPCPSPIRTRSNA